VIGWIARRTLPDEPRIGLDVGGTKRRFLMARDGITIRLTPAERSLLLRYGYPFEQSEAALKACAGSQGIEHVPIDRFNLEQLIGNLCYSINRMKPGKLQDELLALCDRLEAAERYGDGELDVL
jgi:hypothetical protein